jgi:hypothetical protein
MKVDTKQRKKARKGFAQVYGGEDLAARMVHVLQVGKKGLDSLVMELGRMLAETIMDMEREERSGPEGKPLHKAPIFAYSVWRIVFHPLDRFSSATLKSFQSVTALKGFGLQGSVLCCMTVTMPVLFL